MSFAPANADGDAVPVCEEMAIDTATYAGNGGALLVQDGAYIEECGADPATILGVAVSSGGADTDGFSRTGRKEFPPGKMQYYRLGRGQQFTALYIGTLPDNVGGEYGVVRDSDGLWKVDFTDTSATRVRLVRKLVGSLPLTPPAPGTNAVPKVVVEFLPAYIQPPLS